MLKNSILLAIGGALIFLPPLILDIAGNSVKAICKLQLNKRSKAKYSIRKDIYLKNKYGKILTKSKYLLEKSNFYTHSIDVTIIILFIITAILSFQKIKNEFTVIYYTWRILYFSAIYFGILFETMLHKNYSPDVINSKARTFILLLISILEVSLIFSIESHNKFSIQDLGLYISSVCDSHPISNVYFKFCGYIQITAFFSNIQYTKEKELEI
ncbi:hypothetical protein ND861_19195 [Leptospira sp. 2 VSF19]|uniref:Uncharacterized protein n=1 Tax=Leptospira soteropolitanensis TaxID=2950025 RepID=A0AAW5VLY3_9LEPT|nr:hypothetical protein [Leptospira soteropolitanensis]MCW7494797.1 hypothetical protein [Leptospira soteropolitanensis]MCW7502378.1 hypothetical protein [Leptospira soteropolitanensis]MCW7524624.1 hypothetical protein [Leptospira soteropolitanensis]MCW7528491.1 hypothetical protein [Leptospira soteropolitanensis]MCW7532347.1 hypothetical protein [Leptospira soteropolitanensis]